MKECRALSDLYVEIQDDRADEEGYRRFREHISECQPCREEFRWYGLTVQMLNNLDTVAPPADFLGQLSARLDKIDSPSYVTFFRTLFSSAPYIPLPAGIASLALIVVLGFALYNHSVIEALPGFVQGEVSHQAGLRDMDISGKGQSAATRMHAKGTDTTTPQHQPSRMNSSSPAVTNPRSSALVLNSGPAEAEAVGVPTVADKIGADNLTVESPSIDMAVQSLKRFLPDLHGQLVEEVKPGDRGGTVVVGVMIPSKAYADLTSRLINFGAVEAGAGHEVNPPKPIEESPKNVILYIRFRPSH
jgi:hypothetical protein